MKVVANLLLCFLCLCYVSIAQAAPWVEHGDLRLQNNIRLLHDAGILSVSVNTWPLYWSDIKRELDDVELTSLSPAQRTAVRELEFEMRLQSRLGLKRQLGVGLSNGKDLLSAPGRIHDEKLAIRKTFDWDGERFAGRLQVNAQRDEQSEVASDLYGSYLAGTWGSWVLGFGAIDRWWGPGQQTSLILSDNADPVPSLFFRTLGEQEFDTKWLSWIGPWQFETFIGQMEHSRVVPETKLTGMRFSMRPLSGLEIGLSRMMQWGGKGRSENLSTFWQSLSSQGENDGDNAGNQLAGFDARWAFDLAGLPSAVWGQMIGEDEAGYMPSKFMAQAGLESVVWQSPEGHFLGAFFEMTDTTAGALGGTHPNTAYSHSVYQTGLRHRGRALAAMYDNDTRVVSTGLSWQRSDGSLYRAALSRLDLNRDGAAGGNTVSQMAQETYQLDVYHQRIVFEGRLKLGLNLRNEHLQSPQGELEKATFYLGWDWRY